MSQPSSNETDFRRLPAVVIQFYRSSQQARAIREESGQLLARAQDLLRRAAITYLEPAGRAANLSDEDLPNARAKAQQAYTELTLALDRLAQAYVQQGKWGKAWPLVEALIAIEAEGFPEWRRQQERIRTLAAATQALEAGRWEEARAHLQPWLEAHKDDAEAHTLLCEYSALAWHLGAIGIRRTLSGHTNYVYSVAFSPDGRLLASGSYDKTVKVWEVESSRLLQALSGHADSVFGVAFSPDGRLLASASPDKTVRVWEVESGRLLHTLRGHASWVWSVAFSPDGRLLASGSKDNTVKVWEVASGRLLHTLSGHTKEVYSVAFSPDGRLLASGSRDMTVKVWEVESGRLLHTLSGHTNYVYSVAFSPDGRLLASGSEDKTVKVWEVASGRLLQNLRGHAGSVWSVAFSPDGRLLASGSQDKTVKVWGPQA